MSTLTKEAEYRRSGIKHRQEGDDYATRSNEFEGELADGYSAVAEAHHSLASIFLRLGGVDDI